MEGFPPKMEIIRKKREGCSDNGKIVQKVNNDRLR